MTRSRIQEARQYYDAIIRHGPYGPVTPENRGGPKGRYASAVFDAALLPIFREETVAVRLLDFGCGTGLFTSGVAPHVDLVVGLDISPGSLGVARDLSQRAGARVSLVQYDGFRLPFGDASFNRIVARESICHVHDDSVGEILEELARVMEPGGRFHLLDQVSESPRWQRSPIPPWQKKRSVDEVLSIFERAGFDLESAVPVRQPRFPWIYPVWFRLVPSALIPALARLEASWNRRFCSLRTRRWQDALFTFHKRDGGPCHEP